MNRPFVLGAAAVLLFALGVVAANTRVAQGWIPVTAYEADVNKDARVNSGDLGVVASKFGQPVPTVTPVATATTNVSPSPTATPQFDDRYEVSFLGLRSLASYDVITGVGAVSTYTLSVRNTGLEPADVHLNSFGSQFLSHNQQDVFTTLCVAAGSTSGASSGCMPLDQFNTAGVNGLGYGATLLPGETAWAAFTGYFNTATDQSPMVVEATWHYSGNAIAASGAANAVAWVAP